MKRINKKILIPEDSPLEMALKVMNELGKKCLIVTKQDKCIGTLSDGDVRKALLTHTSIDTPIKGIFNKNAFSVLEDEFKKEDLKKIFLEKKYDLIPVLDRII